MNRWATTAVILGLVANLQAAVDQHGLPDFEIREFAVITLRNGTQKVGSINNIDEYGTIEFVEPTGKRIFYQKREYRAYGNPRTLDQAVDERVAWLLANEHPDWSLEVRRTIDKSLEKNLTERARQLALQANAKRPDDLHLAEKALGLLAGVAGKDSDVIAIADRGLKQNAKWMPGYSAKAKALKNLGRDDDLYTLITKEWLPKATTNREANRLLAELASRRGNRKEAMEAYRKLALFHDDPASNRDYGIMAVLSGDLNAAGRAAAKLQELGVEADLTAAINGTIALKEGRTEQADGLLTQAYRGRKALGQMKEVVAYNYGVLRHRQGRLGEAAQAWKGLSLPVAKVALAVARNRPVGGAESLPEPLRTIALEHNICLALTLDQPGQVRDQLRRDVPRHTFLAQVADVLRSNGSEASLRALALTRTVESRHWQIYGHLIANRMDQVKELLEGLPESDGYAAAVRVFIAGNVDDDMDRAARLYRAIANAEGAPQRYVARLAAEFEARDDEVWDVDFSQWTDGANLRTGWTTQNEGTGVTIAVEGGQLVFDGQQRAGQAVSRAFLLASTAKVREISAELDSSGLGEATGGVEILDERQNNGLAVAMLPDGQLGWRQRSTGSWGGWRQIGSGADGSRLKLHLQINPQTGQVVIELPTGGRKGIGKGLVFGTERLAIGFFGLAEADASWRMAANRLTIQLRDPSSGSGPR